MPALLERAARIPKRAVDVVLQRRAETRARAYTPEQRDRVRVLHQAAKRRIRAARELRDASDIVAAGTLYREAGVLAARACVVAQDPESDGELDAAEAWSRLDRITGGEPSAEGAAETPYERARRLATDPDLLAIDKLAAVPAREHLEQIDRALAALLGSLEPRSVRRIRVSRVLRLALVALALLGALAAMIVWLLSPNNVARGKPASAVSYWPGSGPADELVDGQKESPWGSATGRSHDAWFQIDLLDTFEVRRVVVINRDDGFAHTTVPFVIELSEDGSSYSELSRVEGPAAPGQRWSRTGSGRGRFVRVRQLSGTGFALSEIEVYGKKL